MHLLANSSSHDWLSFALGVLAGLATVVFFKFRRRKENR
jgi:LPXTG-motif cell wall-anchored protein